MSSPSTEYEYSFSIRYRDLPDDWRETEASPTMLAVWQLFSHAERVCMDWTEAGFAEFRKNLKEAGFVLDGIRRVELPRPLPEDVE